jgi:hypothetical protein
MADRGAFAHRVFLEDSRANGLYLRVTWHPEHRQFVFSEWHGDICVSAVRVPVAEAPELLTLLANGLADAALIRPPESEAPPPWWRRWGDRWRRPRAPVVELRPRRDERQG